MDEEEKFFSVTPKPKEYKPFNLAFAPDMGGNYKSQGLSFARDGLIADLGRYSTNQGRNYYGYIGGTPYSAGLMQLGGAVGAYGNKENINPLLGLLMQYPIQNGQLRGLLSPSIGGSGPSVFFGYDRKF